MRAGSSRWDLRSLAPAVSLYLAIRALGLTVLALWSTANGASAHVLLSRRWDSLWYARVAEHGYGFTLHAPDGRDLSSMAFFPLLPWLEKTGSALSPLAPSDIGLLVSALASAAAAVGLFALGRQVHSDRAGLILAGLWAALPVAVVQSMAYSESLFVALAAWSLYALLRDRWLTAGVLACLAGLTRPVGVALSAALIMTAVLAERPRPARMIAGCALAPLGAAGYILWTGHQRGEPLGYLDVQAEWGNGFDAGLGFARFLATPVWASPLATALVLAALLALAAWPHRAAWKQRLPISLIVYSAVVTALALGASGYFGSKPRLLIPAFPILLPPAILLARSRPVYTWVTLTALAAVSAVYGAYWLNGTGPP
ncbi:glycosyltransferase family 39 protein [Streptomyces sp. MUM 178J]|uniref:glycosyltransferase family 39 protein n=1 Tax=Streptomyces sp. MUM 178J TaxID=2791991 RepID=UPI001F04AFFA|nr:glycosyltransferase family 39 protein [Streptomyces sp. MUM 178J]WRQ82703.1 glycosyltransferase family 39 protein [Streptomyces sp. MUM 178J]